MHTHLRGLRATMSHIGVKVPVNPPSAHPHPPCCSISCTLYVPEGTRNTHSSIHSMLRVMNFPSGDSWNLKVKGLLDGWRGSHQGSPPKRASSAMSLDSMSSNPTEVSAFVHTSPPHMSGRPSPSSIFFLISWWCAFDLSYLHTC